MSENQEVEHDVFVGRHTGPWRTTGGDGEARQLIDLFAGVSQGPSAAPAQLSTDQARSVASALLREVRAIEGAGREQGPVLELVRRMMAHRGGERTITLEPGIYRIRFSFLGRGGEALSAFSCDALVLSAVNGVRLLEGVEVAQLALRLANPDVAGEQPASEP